MHIATDGVRWVPSQGTATDGVWIGPELQMGADGVRIGLDGSRTTDEVHEPELHLGCRRFRWTADECRQVQQMSVDRSSWSTQWSRGIDTVQMVQVGGVNQGGRGHQLEEVEGVAAWGWEVLRRLA